MRVHIAGAPVQVATKYRQRCAWCDHVLLDGDTDNEMVAPGSATEVRFWEMFSLVVIEGNGSWSMPDDGGPLPAECCASQRKALGLTSAGGKA